MLLLLLSRFSRDQSGTRRHLSDSSLVRASEATQEVTEAQRKRKDEGSRVRMEQHQKVRGCGCL